MPAAAARKPWRKRMRPNMSCPAGCPLSCSSPFAIGLEPMAPRWHTIVSTFADHLPFYRQAEIFRRLGIDLDRGTLGNWGEDRSGRD
jgi:transposase